MPSLWSRVADLLWPHERAGGHTGTKDGETMAPPASTPSGSTARPRPPRAFSAGALRAAEVFAGYAEEFWTGKEARASIGAYGARPGRELLLAKVLRIVQSNGHMLTAIWTLISAEVPSEITCPNCLATIRAPYAEELKHDS